jgi:DNA-binding transcriptional LysR family regulator
MRVRELRILAILAEELHFGRAAERLGMAQPQLSEIVRRIESDAGLTIFVRRPRVRATPGGEVLLETARRVLEALDSGAQRARAVAAGKAGLVVVGFAPIAMLSHLPKVLRRFTAENPDVELKLVEGASGHLRASLERGDLDLMVARESHSEAEFETFRFAFDEVNVLMPEDHPAAALPSVHPSLFSQDEFVMFPRSGNPTYYDRLLRWARDAGLEIRTVREIDSWVGAAALVGAGHGVSLGTNLLSRAAIPGVVSRPFSVPAFDVSFWVSWSPDRLIPAAQKLIELMREAR